MEVEHRMCSGDVDGYFRGLDMVVEEGSSDYYAPVGLAFHEREVAVSQNIEEDKRYAESRE